MMVLVLCFSAIQYSMGFGTEFKAHGTEKKTSQCLTWDYSLS